MKNKLLFSVFVLILALPWAAQAMTGTIDLDRNFAWGEDIGWINFASADALGAYQGLVVTDASITGFAWSSVFGWINFGPSSSGQGVTNTAQGMLGGSAWVAGLGFVDMAGATIDSGGEFRGTAGQGRGASDSQAGRVSFDCANCDVHTTWRPTIVSVPVPAPATPAAPFTSGGGGGGGGGNSTSTPVWVPPPDDAHVPASEALRPSTASNLAASILGVPEAAAAVPSQLFDISLALDGDAFVSGDDIAARAHFVNFGTDPTAVNMTFSILDASGKTVASGDATTTIETEATFPYVFTGLALAPGAYSVRLHTRYGANVNDDFYQPFRVAAPGGGRSWWWLLGLILASGDLFFVLWKRSKDKRADDPYLI